MTPEEIEKEKEIQDMLDHEYKHGFEVGFRQAARFVMNEAKETFEKQGLAGQRAVRLRDVAIDLGKLASRFDSGKWTEEEEQTP